ncbi:MAG: NAD(P)-dependent oxidoreductase [Spirochaetales bacterium]|nr:NAD(P)-dependent oxidoreductase [Spirochaetales bacterium]
MNNIGFIGLGDMGMGMALNLLRNGFSVRGFDLNESCLKHFADEGGIPVESCKSVGENSDVVFIMVMNAEQAITAVLGDDGAASAMKAGSTIIITATIGRGAVLEIEAELKKKEISLIDSPVSGGRGGAEAGTLTLMAAADDLTFSSCSDVFNAIAKNINHVGKDAGQGQTVKHALSVLTGTCYEGIFEALVLGAKAGVDVEALYNVIATSSVGNFIFKDSAKLIMERKFKGTGSHIGTMYKDLGLSMQLARECGVSMPMTSVAMEMFQAGISSFPDEDNWSIIKILEQIAGIEVKAGF